MSVADAFDKTSSNSSQRRVAVIGAGWAGCAAALELANAGLQVHLIEAARQLGGRARKVEYEGLVLDNGQHILLGAYTHTLRLLRQLGVDERHAFLRLPLQMRYPSARDGMVFVAPRLPAPWHLIAALLRARGLDKADRLALARFSTTARWMDWQLHQDCSVPELLERFDQTPNLFRLLWRPLCIAALNTPPERASAKVFLAVLRDSLGARRSASDMLLPRSDLGSLFPEQVARLLARQGGNITTGKLVRQLAQTSAGWEIDGADNYDAIVLATPASQTAALLRNHAPDLALEFDHEAISTCYLRYPTTTRLDAPFYALLDDPETGAWGQFIFDRGQLDASQAGVFSVVVSTANAAIALPREDLAQAVAQQLAEVFGRSELAHPLWTKVISEKRATFSCRPGLSRPENDIGLPRLRLAGDYTASDYPATLETAVRSGAEAARQLIAVLTKTA